MNKVSQRDKSQHWTHIYPFFLSRRAIFSLHFLHSICLFRTVSCPSLVGLDALIVPIFTPSHTENKQQLDHPKNVNQSILYFLYFCIRYLFFSLEIVCVCVCVSASFVSASFIFRAQEILNWDVFWANNV